MNALAGTTNLPEKPTGYLTDSDQSHANGDDGISSGESEVKSLSSLLQGMPSVSLLSE